jgi:hypothetical protein
LCANSHLRQRKRRQFFPWIVAEAADYSLFSRFMPSMSGCQPDTSEIMNTSM